MEATKETLISNFDLDSSDAIDIIEARDLVPALDTMDIAVAKREVASFGPMMDWDVKQVLRFINSVDADLFDDVKGIFAARGFDGK